MTNATAEVWAQEGSDLWGYRRFPRGGTTGWVLKLWHQGGKGGRKGPQCNPGRGVQRFKRASSVQANVKYFSPAGTPGTDTGWLEAQSRWVMLCPEGDGKHLKWGRDNIWITFLKDPLDEAKNRRQVKAVFYFCCLSLCRSNKCYGNSGKFYFLN